jgi:hypothetical protein
LTRSNKAIFSKRERQTADEKAAINGK